MAESGAARFRGLKASEHPMEPLPGGFVSKGVRGGLGSTVSFVTGVLFGLKRNLFGLFVEEMEPSPRRSHLKSVVQVAHSLPLSTQSTFVALKWGIRCLCRCIGTASGVLSWLLLPQGFGS